MTVPRATMRLQLNASFTFRHAAAVVPYCAKLGISHLYLSPILTARAGSMHGYDLVDPNRVNPELGGEEALHELVREVRRHGIGLIVDIVPNHMAIGSDNAWWMDVLTHGRASRFAKYFDIDWAPADDALRNKVALPLLGRPYGEALAAGEITLQRGPPHFIRYFEHCFPVSPESFATAAENPARDFDVRHAAGRERLHKLIEMQHYRLMWWRAANDEINWRRFFDINELVAVRVEDQDVFEAVHATTFRLYADGLLDGIRVDHIDGLSLPEQYCRQLRRRLHSLESHRPSSSPGGAVYVVVEKILSRDEALPRAWEIDGTTGYDFMNEVNGLQHDARGERPLTDLWVQTSGRAADFTVEEELARRQILQRSFAAPFEAVVQAISAIAQRDLATRDISISALRRCLAEILVHFPVYRTYARVEQASEADRRFLDRALAGAKSTCLLSDQWLVDLLGRWLSGKRIRADLDALQANVLTRFQQLSGALCAKAVEDTAFYRYGRLISRNDVGFDARAFSYTATEFHRRMELRATRLPHSMLATATHDHKRGEDVRARLAVLSELQADWSRAVAQWLDAAAAHCRTVDDRWMPSRGDLYILFQTIVGAWPLDLTIADTEGLLRYRDRLLLWQQKALREAKLHSDWSSPNEPYENAAREFVIWLFSRPSELLVQLQNFATGIAQAGAANGLAQALIKLTAPGVPDLYQGTDFWDLSLVDPDNRSPVDFAVREKALDTGFSAEDISIWTDPRVKQFIVVKALAARKELPSLFGDGAYTPLVVTGPLADHVLAFARILPGQLAVTAVIRRLTPLANHNGPFSAALQQLASTALIIPAEFQGLTYVSALHRNKQQRLESALPVRQLFDPLPVALIIAK